MAICAKCGKKLGFFSKCWIKWQDDKKTYYCQECYEKLSVCAKCSKSLDSFKNIEVVTDKNGKNIYYCPDCFEKEKKKVIIKKKEKTEKFKTELMNNEFILRFSEKYSTICLSLIRLRQLHKLKEEIQDDEILYNQLIDIILSNKLSNFRNLFSLDWTVVKEKVGWINTYCYEGITKKKVVEDINFLVYDFLCFDKDEQEAFLNFLDIILKKYNNLTTSLLVEILDFISRNQLLQEVDSDFNKLKTEEDLFKELIEHYLILVEQIRGDVRVRFAGKELLKIIFDCARTKKLTNCKSVEELREKVKEFKKTSKLKDFESKLLKPSTNTIDIEDIDLMNGFEFEDFLSKLFRNMGYKVVQTKLSGDQGADLTIERNNKKTVVQAKCYSGKLSNKAIQEVVASIKHYKASAGMVVTNSYFTPSAVKLADSNDIRLIDRDKLKELIEKYIN